MIQRLVGDPEQFARLLLWSRFPVDSHILNQGKGVELLSHFRAQRIFLLATSKDVILMNRDES